MDLTLRASPEVMKDYMCLFVNRRAYTLQSMRPHPETGRHYYFRPRVKGSDRPIALTEETIQDHLEGVITIGLYAINPSTQRCKWVAVDADYKNSMDDLLKLQYYLGQDQVQAALEMTKRGGHLWIFLATPLLAKECRIYIYNLALRLGVPVKGAGWPDGIEIFPKHEALSQGAFGNAIRGPLGIHRGANRVEGKLQTTSWEDRQSGEKKYRTEIVARDLVLLGSRDNSGDGGRPSASEKPEKDKKTDPAITRPADISDEGVPF